MKGAQRPTQSTSLTKSSAKVDWAKVFNLWLILLLVVRAKSFYFSKYEWDRIFLYFVSTACFVISIIFVATGHYDEQGILFTITFFLLGAIFLYKAIYDPFIITYL